MEQNSKFDLWLKGVVITLITIAAILLTFPFIQNYYALQIKNSETTHYRSTPPNSMPTAETIHALKLRDMLGVKGENKDAIGRVLIPSVGLDDNIYVGLTNGNLAVGAVTMFPKRVPVQHNVVLLGHNVGFKGLHFGLLSQVKLKEKIYLNYLNRYYQYQIYRVESINETEIEKVKDISDSQLSLVTCSAPTRTPKRILVRANLVKVLNTPSEKKQMRSVAKTTANKSLIQLHNGMWQMVWLPIFAIVIVYTIVMIILLKQMNQKNK
jgi:LPXTG-site transpeptidase (sortase) family protein